MVFGSFWNSVEKNNNTECFGDLVVRTRSFEKSFGLDNTVHGNFRNEKVNLIFLSLNYLKFLFFTQNMII